MIDAAALRFCVPKMEQVIKILPLCGYSNYSFPSSRGKASSARCTWVLSLATAVGSWV